MPFLDRQLAFLTALAALFAGGCQGEPADLTVEVCGDVRVPRQVDALRFEVLDADREVVEGRVLELLLCPAGDVRHLPVSADFPTRQGTTWVAVEALKEGQRVSRYERRLELDGGDEPRDVRLAVQETCLGVISCPDSETCAAGRCRPIPREENDPVQCAPQPPADTGLVDGGETTDTSSPGDAGDLGDTGNEESFAPRSLCPSYDAGSPEDADDAVDGTELE